MLSMTMLTESKDLQMKRLRDRKKRMNARKSKMNLFRSRPGLQLRKRQKRPKLIRMMMILLLSKFRLRTSPLPKSCRRHGLDLTNLSRKSLQPPPMLRTRTRNQ